MSTQPLADINLPKDSYIAFDAFSMRELILRRLKEQGVFTDQDQIGSNLASIIDIVAYSFKTLMFYLNRTSNEAMFTESQIYENINRIVKMIDYKPLGYQASLLPYRLEIATDIPYGSTYTIPRYSMVSVGSVMYSFNEDLVFFKSTNGYQTIDTAKDTKFLVQGKFVESPVYIAEGKEYEAVYIKPQQATKKYIDHNNIHVYVKNVNTNKWTKYRQTNNLYLENGNNLVYEARLNEDKNYELLFGDGVNGRMLEAGDSICIYYVLCDGEQGLVGEYAFYRQPISRFNTVVYDEILSSEQLNRTLTTDEIKYCLVTNTSRSTPVCEAETVEDIRRYAPSVYKSQYRLVTPEDFSSFIRQRFNSFVKDISIMTNNRYMETYIKYLYDLGLTDPTLIDRPLYNQSLFGSPCTFNNVYIVSVPRTNIESEAYLSPTQKQIIAKTLEDVKSININISFVDPTYMAVALGIWGFTQENNVINNNAQPLQIDTGVEDSTVLQIFKSQTVKVSDDSLISRVRDLISEYFNALNTRLGQSIDVRVLEQSILGIEGIESVRTIRTDNDTIIHNGLSFLVWNPVYNGNLGEGRGLGDITTLTGSMRLLEFQIPYLYDINKLYSKIQVV